MHAMQVEFIYTAVQIPPTKGPIDGTLFYIGNAPTGESSFWIQQYPTYFGERGRIVVEFWNGSQIQAVVSRLSI